MKKRLLAALLAVCLALTLLPAWALAADTGYWAGMTAAEAKEMLQAVASGSETRYMVFVYHDAASQTRAQACADYANQNRLYIYHYSGSESLSDELAPLFGGTAPTAMPVAVTYNPSTREYLANENVMLMDPGGVFSSLVDQMKANGVDSGASAPDQPAEPDTPPVTPDVPEVPDYSNSSTSIPNVHPYAWEVLRQVNQHRMEKGLQPLSVFAGLQQAANLRAVELYTLWSHTRPDGTQFDTVYAPMGVVYDYVQENIASGQRDASDVMASWLNSPGHRANIENTRSVHLGVGYYYNDHQPDRGAQNWSQNFAACGNCRFTNLRLSAGSVTGRPGADLESLLQPADIEVTADCYRHGKCSLPLIAAMCDGYVKDSADTQTLTVSYNGQTAVLTVTGTAAPDPGPGDDPGHTHTWDSGKVTQAPACTAAGTKTYTCTECGETRTETVAPAGHDFQEVMLEGEFLEYVCQTPNGCGTALPEKELASAYQTIRLQDGRTLPSDVSAAKASIEAYLTEQAEDAIEDAHCEAAYTCTIINGKFADNNTKYVYQVCIRPNARGRITYFTELVTEPLTLLIPTGAAAEEDEYYISLSQTGSGTLTASARRAVPGKAVTIFARPDSGYELTSVTAADVRGRRISLRSLGGEAYSFTMPVSNVTVDAVFEKVKDSGSTNTPGTTTAPDEDEPFTGLGTPGISGIVLNPSPMPFTDVQSSHWFYNSVDYVWKHYLMTGVSDTSFAPNTTTSRAMIWTVLARMSNVRTDINPGSAWYEKGMLWAMEKGVTDGSNPMASITREQLVTMLWRNAGSPNAAADLSAFGDSAGVSEYAQSAVRWAAANGILKGSNGQLNPRGTATRAEVAAMVMRYASVIG